jgi:YVTN family beta-propeller protein
MVPRVASQAAIQKLIAPVVVFALLASATLFIRAQTAPVSTATPGGLGDGTTLLANGWRIAPTGRHLPLGTLPLNIATAPDGRYALVTNNGLAKPTLTMIDLSNWLVKSTTALDAAWYGLAWSPDGKNVYIGGAAQNNVQEFSYANGVLTRARTFTLPAQSGDTFAGGLAISPDGRRLYVTRVFAQTLSSIDLASGQVIQTVPLPAEPYTCLVSADGRYVYVSIWGAAEVAVFTSDSLQSAEPLQTGEHPNALALSKDGQRLFVACGSDNSVWVFEFGYPIEQISTSLFLDAPPTSTPNSLGLSPDGRTLLVANADNNAVAVIDVSNAAHSFVEGFIPAGWYPTGAVFTRDGNQVLILNGKGLVPAANPLNGGLDRRLAGDLETVPTPDRTALADYTRKVYAVTPYSTAPPGWAPVNAPVGSPIPRTVGGSSPIKHVFYVIRENRTYDQILGDLAVGNGEPKLTLFGQTVTPNAHALSTTFVDFDNFYTDADVSYDGHSFSTAAYATDFVQKIWQTYYANRGGIYLGEGNGAMRNAFGNITAPQRGYIWDAARSAQVTVRSYGEYTLNLSKTGTDVVVGEAVPGLKGIVAPAYAGWDLDITDSKRIETWLAEFRTYEQNGQLPRLSIIRLPNDHTSGAKPGAPTPRAMIAENDLALGRLVEAISTSAVYWKDSAVFVLEDDAQSGPDHIDSHRSVLLVASPFARRGAVDHTFYTTSAVLRTIELILGLPPMSQYDAAATPLYNAFTATPNTAAYQRVLPGVPLDERNLPSAYGATASLHMDFSVGDRAPEQLLNEIIWRSVKGANSPMPPPRHSLFVRSSSPAAADDDR